MTHLDEDDLILRYYGEDGGAGAPHLAGCPQCAAAYAALAADLDAIRPEDVAADDLLASRLWTRVERALPAPRRTAATWTAGLAAAAAILLAFWLGRTSAPPAPPVARAQRRGGARAHPAGRGRRPPGARADGAARDRERARGRHGRPVRVAALRPGPRVGEPAVPPGRGAGRRARGRERPGRAGARAGRGRAQRRAAARPRRSITCATASSRRGFCSACASSAPRSGRSRRTRIAGTSNREENHDREDGDRDGGRGRAARRRGLAARAGGRGAPRAGTRRARPGSGRAGPGSAPSARPTATSARWTSWTTASGRRRSTRSSRS